MSDALDLVRKELGQDAVVIESKEIASRRILPWMSTRQEFEVSAQEHIPQSNPNKLNRPGSASPRVIRTLAESNSESANKPRILEPIRELESDVPADIKSIADSSTTIRTEAVRPDSVPPDNPLASAASNDAAAGQSLLESLNQLIARLERQSGSGSIIEIPTELIPCYHRILEKDIEDEIARDLITRLRQHCASDVFSSPTLAMVTLTALVEREMRCAPPIQPKPGRREIVTLIGPTGVGKTTTLAKLAGRFHLQEGLRVGLITVDTYRVGAIEQLQTYADILQIPLHAVSNTDELRQAIDQMDNVDLILIDTAGRSPFDHQKMNELCELVQVATSDHLMLVMSLATDTRNLARIADRFSTVAPTSLIITKLDESHRSGGLLSIARQIPYPIRYLTTGQDVPDQIEPAHPHRLARLVLGCDQI